MVLILGIEIRNKGGTQLISSHNCAFYPTTEHCPIDKWQPLVSNRNIYLLELKMNKELPQNIEKFHTTAILFVAENDLLHQSDKFSSLMITNFPMVLVKKNDGAEIVAHLKQDQGLTIVFSTELEGEDKQANVPQAQTSMCK